MNIIICIVIIQVENQPVLYDIYNFTCQVQWQFNWFVLYNIYRYYFGIKLLWKRCVSYYIFAEWRVLQLTGVFFKCDTTDRCICYFYTMQFPSKWDNELFSKHPPSPLEPSDELCFNHRAHSHGRVQITCYRSLMLSVILS